MIVFTVLSGKSSCSCQPSLQGQLGLIGVIEGLWEEAPLVEKRERTLFVIDTNPREQACLVIIGARQGRLAQYVEAQASMLDHIIILTTETVRGQ